MKKLAGWSVLILMVLVLSACGGKPLMVKCPNCGSVFDAQEHIIELDKTKG
ncbi:hypothetical protein [Pelovirga terrestris]|uniref:Lipoprotein n=1 Tax=Pelovirga terrestris TaxID=2771352 RepID=A0A8J6QUH6_9BACT|nr:hypothetical protein [Pelovirga terrestris]MBD1400310.1 hypothetical protein [Pelovirga terrestris]